MEWKLAEQIRAFRQEKGMTQERLAEAVGVTVGAVSKWESGASVPELSVLVELASLFGTSVDTLIGYEVPDNALPALLRRLRACRDAHQFDEGNEVARRLLRCYPNSFEAVYHTAGFYYCQGLTQAENQEMRRAIALYERSLALLSQNTDPEIGEISIRESIASARISLGEEEEGVRELKQHNDNEIYDSLIGITLAYTDQKDEARRYLFRSYLRLTADLVRISFGFVNTAEAWDEQKQVLELFDRVLYFLDGMTEPGRVSFVTKAEALILAVCAHLCVGWGKTRRRKRIFAGPGDGAAFRRGSGLQCNGNSLLLRRSSACRLRRYRGDGYAGSRKIYQGNGRDSACALAAVGGMEP